MAAPEHRGVPHGMRRFQSLFWWIGDGGDAAVYVSVVSMGVSILVLVDW